MNDGHNRNQDRGIFTDPGLGGYYHIVDGRSDMGPEERYLQSTNPEYRSARSPGDGRPGADSANRDGNRDYKSRGARVYRSDPAPKGVILGRLYRLIFGGVMMVRDHDQEVRDAQNRVATALEGLDRDVLVLMKATMDSDPPALI